MNPQIEITGTVTHLDITTEGEAGGAVAVAQVEEDQHGRPLPAEQVGRAWLRLTPASVEYLASRYAVHTGPAAMYGLASMFAAYLDRENGTDGEEIATRIMKVGEEFGEVVQAWIAATGKNPRKRRAHATSDPWDADRQPTTVDVAQELADVVLSALVAITSLGYNAEAIMAGRVARVQARLRPADRVVA